MVLTGFPRVLDQFGTSGGKFPAEAEPAMITADVAAAWPKNFLLLFSDALFSNAPENGTSLFVSLSIIDLSSAMITPIVYSLATSNIIKRIGKKSRYYCEYL